MQSMWKLDMYVLIHNQVFHSKRFFITLCAFLFNFMYLQSIVRFCANYTIKVFQEKNRNFQKLFM